MVNNLLANYDKLVKRFLILSLIQQGGEATLDNVEELAKIRKELYKVTRNAKK
jgi:hypothetical protein